MFGSSDREELAALRRQVATQQQMIQLLAAHVGVDLAMMDPYALSAEVRALVAQGKKIEAIKVYRQETGVGLAEAKRRVEEG
ncbi:ribosomal L7/L12 family protein [Parenemella sanctibonifatiensis]|uniref:Ribosomal protein L7/L12 C-terminal domain-containing protein n=1 Tax=Parenemella sanctibonifatiensis TaxID=2016505 RepID=A0A255E183_9ACTN|nr:hypothetical protein [Parenemella sanctibonifatiensis]OYN85256.1 hypothetical protein CGZ92_10635 [Parenemella sanctibonifatiensis]